MQKPIGTAQIKASLAKKHACYVLITCSRPTANGKLHVDMSYQGDPFLASMMLQNAQNIIAEDTADIES